MRKLKFRVWHKIENRWLEPEAEEDPMLSLKDHGEGCEVFLYDRASDEWSNENCLMKNIVIQQYTGLKDMDGVEIFEGDILQEEYSDKDYPVSRLQTEIRWSKAYSGFQWCEHRLSDGDLVDFYGGISQTDYKRVIGNIFEGVRST